MAKNVVINGSTYNAVPYIQVPLAAGGGNAVFYETSDASSSLASVLLVGNSAYGQNGKENGQLTVPTISQDSTTKVLSIS